MRIAIDLTPTIQTQAGLGRNAAELTRALLATRQPNEQIEVFCLNQQHRSLATPFSELPGQYLNLASKPWRFLVLLAYLFQRSQDQLIGQPDIFLATDHLLPYLRTTVSIFTLGDVTFVSQAQTHSRLNRSYLRLMMPHFLRRADVVVAISECTLQEAGFHYPIVQRKGRVIYPAVSHNFKAVTEQTALANLRRRYRLPEKFILYVGTVEPRKNLPMLLEAFKQAQTDMPEVKLVIAGKKGWLFGETFARVEALGLAQDVIFTDYMPDEDLPALYSLATAFVFPSLYEGFGLPVLEAMACGTPVICSNTSSLPEVAGEAAILISPDDVRGWSQGITQLVQNVSLQHMLHQRGLKQAACFTWAATAQKTRELYREVYARRT